MNQMLNSIRYMSVIQCLLLSELAARAVIGRIVQQTND